MPLTLLRKCNWFHSALFVLITISAGVQIWAGADGDKEFCLYIARQLVAGKHLYLEMVEPSPPLIFWILTIPVTIGSWVGIMQGYVLSTLGLALCVLSGWLANVLIRQHPEFAVNAQQRTLFAFLVAFLFVVWESPAHFADREHLIMVLIFPYLIRNLPSLQSAVIPKFIAIVIGIMAGVGFCIKPHAVIIFVVVQVLIFIRERELRKLFRLETMIVGVIGVMYLLAIGIYTPEYYTTIIPIARQTYAATNRGIGVLFSITTSVFMLAVTLSDFRLRYDSPYRKDIYYFFGLCAACALYVYANNGWAYTFYPLNTIILLLTAWVYLECNWLLASSAFSASQQKQFLFSKRACSLNLFVNTGLVFLTYTMVFTMPNPGIATSIKMQEDIIASVKEEKAHGFGVISMNFGYWSSVADVSGVEQVTRFSNLWMLTGLLSEDKDASHKNHWVVEYVGAAFAEDLRRHMPEVIFVETTPSTHAAGMQSSLLRLLLLSKDFSTEWKQYFLHRVINNCEKNDPNTTNAQSDCVYDVYSRIVEDTAK